MDKTYKEIKKDVTILNDLKRAKIHFDNLNNTPIEYFGKVFSEITQELSIDTEDLSFLILNITGSAIYAYEQLKQKNSYAEHKKNMPLKEHPEINNIINHFKGAEKIIDPYTEKEHSINILDYNKKGIHVENKGLFIYIIEEDESVRTSTPVFLWSKLHGYADITVKKKF